MVCLASSWVGIPVRQKAGTPTASIPACPPPSPASRATAYSQCSSLPASLLLLAPAHLLLPLPLLWCLPTYLPTTTTSCLLPGPWWSMEALAAAAVLPPQLPPAHFFCYSSACPPASSSITSSGLPASLLACALHRQGHGGTQR